jgi:sugar phosphate isomerase/epimerase
MMQLCICASTFQGSDPAAVLARVAASGFSGTQYDLACSGLEQMPDVIPSATAQAISAAASATGIRIVAISGTYNMIHPNPAVRRQGHTRLEALAAACGAMSTRVITLCTGTRDPDNEWRFHPDNGTPEAWRDLLESMEQAAAIAERYNVDIGIEPELSNVVSSAVKARRLIDEIGSPRLTIIFDPANLFDVDTMDRQRDIIAASIDLLADRITMAHAKDRTSDGRFTTAGKGVLDYAYVAEQLKRIGFDGPVVAHTLSPGDAPGVAVFLRQALAGAGIAVAP